MDIGIRYKKLRNGNVGVYLGRRKTGEIIEMYGGGEFYYLPEGRGSRFQPKKTYKTVEDLKKDLEGE